MEPGLVTIYAGDWWISGPDPGEPIPLEDVLLARPHRPFG